MSMRASVAADDALLLMREASRLSADVSRRLI